MTDYLVFQCNVDGDHAKVASVVAPSLGIAQAVAISRYERFVIIERADSEAGCSEQRVYAQGIPA